MVTTSMTVPTLARALAQLMQVSTPVSIYVAPVWAPLDHLGFIVDRVLPGTDTACPFLHPGSLVRVFRNDPDASGNIWSLTSRTRLVRFPDFSSSATASTNSSTGRPLRNGEGGSSMTADDIARYDANTLAILEFIVGHNATPQPGRDGLSPRELVSGSREFSYCLREVPTMQLVELHGGDRFRPKREVSTVQIEEVQGSSIEEVQGSSSCDDPPPKRFRLDGQPGRDSPPREGEPWIPAPVLDPLTKKVPVLVSRWERSNLLSKFKREQRLDRQRFKLEVSRQWDAEMAENKENQKTEVDPETEAEAYEDYLFDRLMRYDGDAAFLLVDFRSSLRVVPEQVGGSIAELSSLRNRTDNLWEGLRRVYFGEKEREQVELVPELSHQQVMQNLRDEIAELEGRLGRRQFPEDPERPPLSFQREDDEDDDPSSVSMGHTNVPPETTTGLLVTFATVPEASPALETIVDGRVTMDIGSSALIGSRLETPSAAGSSGSSAFRPAIVKACLISKKILRRIMAAKESLVKFGTFVPRNDRQADESPEAPRWRAGRDLEWFRLGKEGTFDGNWTWEKVSSSYPDYKKSDVGFLFYVYDFKFSGEHRVRLVFDGSRQGESTYKETYAPTVRAESVRLFHIFCVEEGLQIGQYDVPQAFLKADIDHDIFVYPPKGQSEFGGQLLKLRRALYGGKQSAYLWFTMMNSFLISLGFTSSPLDSCFYRREDAVLILYCDDLRIGASSSVLASLHQSLSEKFSVTTAKGDRFLGMDVTYNLALGELKLSMKSYIETTMERFKNFDLSQGFPFRELVGCLLWVTLNVMGPELLRVKELARLSNSFGETEYLLAMKVLRRVFVRRNHGIMIFRNAAGRELIPSSSRAAGVSDLGKAVESQHEVVVSFAHSVSEWDNELTRHSLCQGKVLLADVGNNYAVADSEQLDLQRVLLAVNLRYRLLAYGDASFAVGESKQSITGLIVYLNGVPLLWGSLKQTVVVDSSSSAEFVAASVTCKQLLHAENMVGFLGFSCPKPYTLYTDSMSCFHIASNPNRLGNVRHLQIRYHLVRCYVSLGDVEMCFCITEEMVADLLTKIVVGSQDQRLSLRFFSLIPESDCKVTACICIRVD